MANIYDKINDRMNAIQHWMEGNYHLKNPEVVNEVIDSVTKFWSVMSEEDKDYIQCARIAIEEQKEWNI
jgi:hypothetical protein